MSKINVLPQEVAELIAAGEVVERPMSAVKELIENSIDAGSTAITVEIKNGGVKYLRVTDNGCGIAKEDLKTAFVSHATSKIRTREDLDKILTLGFRGEALPSIARVSHIRVLSRTPDREIGAVLTASGNEDFVVEDAGGPVGTTVIVRDLFFNTPARMKFLKKDVTEGNWVADAVTKTALSHPEIRFTFIRDEKRVFSTPGNGDLLACVASLFGRQVTEGLIPCAFENGDIAVRGFVSKPLSNRPTRNMQYFFVNGRYVRIPAGATALDRAYQNTVMVGKFPMCFLNITLPAEKTDVNVHPTKTEIRFSDEAKLFETLYYAAKRAIANGDRSYPGVTLTGRNSILEEAEGKQLAFSVKTGALSDQDEPVHSAPASASKPVRAVRPAVLPDKTEPKAPVSEKESPAQFVSRIAGPHTDPIAAKPAFEPDRRIDITRDEGEESAPVPKPDSISAPPLRSYTLRDGSGVSSVFDRPAPGPAVDYAGRFRELNEKKKTEDEAFPTARVLGQAFRTYIIAECGEKLFIIDKHAAHERMLFNRLSKGKDGFHAQLLLTPVSVALSGAEYAAVADNLPLFRQAGYEIEEFGGSTVLVRSCPVELTRESVADLVQELAGKLLSCDRAPVPEKLNWLWHSTACRAAIKGGDDMTLPEMQSFVDRLLQDPDVRYCPHGRPVLYELSRHELEKQFGRLG